MTDRDKETAAFAMLVIAFVAYAVTDTLQDNGLRREVARLDDLMHRIAMVQAKQIIAHNQLTNGVTLTFTQDAIGSFTARFSTNKP